MNWTPESKVVSIYFIENEPGMVSNTLKLLNMSNIKATWIKNP